MEIEEEQNDGENADGGEGNGCRSELRCASEGNARPHRLEESRITDAHLERNTLDDVAVLAPDQKRSAISNA